MLLLDKHNAKYAAPYLLNPTKRGVRCLYHIKDVSDDGQSTVLELGKSFLLDKPWDGMGNNLRYEYKNLEDFNFIETTDGILTSC